METLLVSIDPAAPLTAQVRPWGLEKRGSATGTCVYVFRDEQDRPLYVGVAASIPDRWQAHKKRASWWPHVRSVSVTLPYGDKAQAERIEVRLIRGLRPVGNSRGLVWFDRQGQPQPTQIHGAITDGSLSDHCGAGTNRSRIAHWGKGREGKGREEEGKNPLQSPPCPPASKQRARHNGRTA
jgi:predicted GIY-YIG superfamily endonuclease